MSANLHSAPEVALQAISDLLRAQPLLSQSLYEQSCSARWQFTFEHFVKILARSAASRFKPGIPSVGELENYLALLHLQDLALASACAAGNEFAWEYFIKNFRSYLHSAAAAILKRSADSPEASELADALFAELYGMDEAKPGRGSLLNYFHGRSKLSTWLRTVLAQTPHRRRSHQQTLGNLSMSRRRMGTLVVSRQQPSALSPRQTRTARNISRCSRLP